MSYTTEEKIKLAGENSKDRLYEPKHNQKAIKVVTVAAYILCVSLAAIILSLYYVFIWDPTIKQIQPRAAVNCDKMVIPENIAIRLANSSEISADKFYTNFFKRLQTLNSNDLLFSYPIANKEGNSDKLKDGKKDSTDTLASSTPVESYRKYDRNDDNTHNSKSNNNNENEDDENNEYEQSGYSINYSNDTNINLDDQY